MRILLVADLHYTLRQLDWVVAAAADYDLVVLAGDHLYIASIVEPDAQITVMLEYFSRIAAKTAVIASSGNHDLNARDEYQERYARWLGRAGDSGIVVDGSHFANDEVFVTVCPWWDGPHARDAVDRQLRDDAAAVGERQWIWVYHGPPADSPTSWTGRRHYGDDDLVAWIGAHHPDIVLCGHVHESPFVTDGAWIDRIGSTLVMNAGRQIGSVPAHIELDIDAGVARWSSIAGNEERAFSAV